MSPVMREIFWVSHLRIWSVQNVPHGEQSVPSNRTQNTKSLLMPWLLTKSKLRKHFIVTVRMSSTSFKPECSANRQKLRQKHSSWRWSEITTGTSLRLPRETSLSMSKLKLTRHIMKPINWSYQHAILLSLVLPWTNQCFTMKWWRITKRHVSWQMRPYNKPLRKSMSWERMISETQRASLNYSKRTSLCGRKKKRAETVELKISEQLGWCRNDRNFKFMRSFWKSEFF